MKGHKIAPKHMHEKASHLMRKRGGEVSRDDDGPEDGTDEAEEDLKLKPERRNNSGIESDAEEMKAKRGGAVKILLVLCCFMVGCAKRPPIVTPP